MYAYVRSGTQSVTQFENWSFPMKNHNTGHEKCIIPSFTKIAILFEIWLAHCCWFYILFLGIFYSLSDYTVYMIKLLFYWYTANLIMSSSYIKKIIYEPRKWKFSFNTSAVSKICWRKCKEWEIESFQIKLVSLYHYYSVNVILLEVWFCIKSYYSYVERIFFRRWYTNFIQELKIHTFYSKKGTGS